MITKPLEILLADDDDEDCLFFKEVLDEIAFSSKLNIVKNGAELMKYLVQNSDSLPDVLFLDLNMPIKNGFECLDEIKLARHLHSLPVIILSTSRQESIIGMLYKIGALRYIRKTESFESLKKVICQALTIIEQKDFERPIRGSFVLNDLVEV